MVIIHLHTIILNQSMFMSVHSKAVLERFTAVTGYPVNCCLRSTTAPRKTTQQQHIIVSYTNLLIGL